MVTKPAGNPRRASFFPFAALPYGRGQTETGERFQGVDGAKRVRFPENAARAGRAPPTARSAREFILKPDKKLEKLFIAQGASGFYETA